ncbi:hypothetical protein G7Y89_g15536 [Cudoniella acicularis]|uniref:Uncharacterized protein n=1 Tax=Cudoniella acicularis TaxID=354080 RepID=A0A8H4VK59_9HELO|nr:hypothetical protein G7Y89_g15536 [Cudoniella acicularis]
MATPKEDVASGNDATGSGRIEHTLPTTGVDSEDIIFVRKRRREDECQSTSSNGLILRPRKRRRCQEDLRTRTLRALLPHKTSPQPPAALPSTHIYGSSGTTLDAALLPFKYREAEIEIVKSIGNGPHFVVFKIIAGKKSYHLYVYKHSFESMSNDGLLESNTFFENARAAHARANSLHAEMANVPAPLCHGYVNLSKLPRESKRLRPPSRSTKVTSAAYTRFLYRRKSNAHDASREEAWRLYFESKGVYAKYILQGLVMDEIIDWEPFADSKFWCRDLETWHFLPGRPAPYPVARSIIQNLELIHTKGIVYSSVLNLDNIWLQETGESGELRIFLTDFTLAEVGEPGSKKLRWKQAKELKWWKQQAAILSAG